MHVTVLSITFNKIVGNYSQIGNRTNIPIDHLKLQFIIGMDACDSAFNYI